MNKRGKPLINKDGCIAKPIVDYDRLIDELEKNDKIELTRKLILTMQNLHLAVHKLIMSRLTDDEKAHMTIDEFMKMQNAEIRRIASESVAIINTKIKNTKYS